MKINAFRILAICLAMVLLFAVGVSAEDAADTLTLTDSKDGIVAILTTDRNSYGENDPVRINLEITNNTGKRVSVNSQVQAPEGFSAANGSVEAVLMEAGQTQKIMEASMIAGAITEQKEKENKGSLLWLWILLAVVVVAAAVFAFFYVKKKRSATSMLLCLIVGGALILGIAPTVDASRNEVAFTSSFVTGKTVTIGDKEVEVRALVSYEVGVPEPEEAPVTPQPEPDKNTATNNNNNSDKKDDRLTAFYFNDFEDDQRYFGSGATVSMNNNWFEKKTKGKNTYLEMSIIDSSAGGYIQADFKNNKLVDNLVYTVSLSTNGQLPIGSYMQYRYKGDANYTFLYINQDGSLQIGGTNYPDVKITKDKWLQLTFVFDLSSDPNADYAKVYVKDKFLTKITLAKHEEFYKIPYMRISMVGKSGKIDNLGATLLVDNLAIYESKKILALDKIKSAPYDTWTPPTVIKDTPMDYPELAEFGEQVVAVLAGTDKAYVNGEVLTLPAQTKGTYVGSRFTDVRVSADFLEQHLGITGLSEGNYSLLRYAKGWNVFVDSRGLVVLTKDVVLNENDNIDAVTMLHGYLKTGELVFNYATAPVFTQSIIDKAMTAQLVPFPAYAGRNDYAQESVSATYYLVLTTHLDENATATDGRLCKDEAVRRLRFLLAGGNEPYASPGCWWAHGIASSAIVLAKNTPAIWNSLTKEEIAKADLLMECLAIAANWGYNEKNDYKTGFDLLGNFGKDYNPNYLNSYLTCYFSASMYFGAEKLDKIFLAFDYNSYIKRLEKAGFENVLSTWTNTDIVGVSIGEYMTNGGDVMLVGNISGDNQQKPEAKPAGTGAGVKIAWAYQDRNSNKVYHAGDYVPLFIEVVEYTYRWCCQSENRAKGAQYWAHIISGKPSPWEGQMGMMSEFSGSDGGGAHARSRTMYCWLSFQNIVPLYANLKLLGYWDHSAQSAETAQRMLEMDRRIMVGHEDLLFKIHEGYIAYSGQVEYKELEESYNEGQGLPYHADIWRNFHAMCSVDVEIDSKNLENVLAPHAEPKDGVTQPPKGAILNKNRDSGGKLVYDYYEPLDGKCYTSGKMEFDVVVGDEVNETTFDSIIIIDRAMRNKMLGDSPMLFAFSKGYISVYSATGYKQTGLQFGENYRYHFMVDFDVKEQLYTVEITQTWPQTDKKVSYTAKDCNFRLSASTLYVDSITVTGPGQDTLWVENLKMLGGKTRVKSPYKETYDLTVKNLWDGVPAAARPKSFTVRLVMNGTATGRTITFTKKDNWAKKVFDNLPKQLNKFDVDWSIQVEKIDNYYPVCSGVKDDTITISWIEDSLFVKEDFEDGVLDTLVDESNRLTSLKPGVIATEGKNHYYCLENDGVGNQLCVVARGLTENRALTGKFNNVIMQMDLKLSNSKQVVNGHINYRKVNGENAVVACSFILINDNVVKFTDENRIVNLGVLTDEWQTLKIWFDVKNNDMMVSFGEDTNFALKTEMPPIVADELRLATSAESGALCVDNFLAHCDKKWTMQKNLQTMKTAVDVKINWDGITPADSVKVSLLANGLPTGKTITLNAAGKWSGRFTGLQKYVSGTTEVVYTIEVPPVAGYNGVPAPMLGSLIEVNYAKKLSFYNDNFNDKDYGKITSYGGSVLGVMGSGGKHWIHMGGKHAGLFEISDRLMTTAPNLVMEMKLMIDKDHKDIAMFRHSSTGAEKDKTQIFAVFANGDVRTGSAASSTFKTLQVNEWTYLKFVMNFESNTLKIYDENGKLLANKKNISDNNGNFVRMWSASAASLHVDDLKIYCEPIVVENQEPDEPVQQEITLSVNADWVDITPAASVKVTLVANGIPTDKTLTLSAANQWSGKFTELPMYSEGTTKIVYAITAAASDGTYGVVSAVKNNAASVTYAKKLLIYSDDFDGNKTGTMQLPGSSELPIVGSGQNRWLQLGAGKGGTFTIADSRILGVPNMTLEMKLMVDAAHVENNAASKETVQFRYNSTGAQDAKTQIFSVFGSGGLRSSSAASSTFKTPAVDQWMYLRVDMDFVNGTVQFYDEFGKVLATKPLNANDGDYLRIWTDAAASVRVDDLKVYSQPQGLVAPEAKTNLNVNVVWSDVTAPQSLELELLADGQPTGRKLTLNAAGQWRGVFDGLAVYNAQQKEIQYSVKAPKVSGVSALVAAEGENSLKVTYIGKMYYYQEDFDDGDWGILDPRGSVAITPSGAATNRWLSYVSGTTLLSLDTSVVSAKNLVLEMKLMIGEDFNGGVSFRYDSDGAANNKTEIFAVNADDHIGLSYGTKASTRGSFYAMSANQWVYLKVVMDWETKTCTFYDVNGTVLKEKKNISQIDGSSLQIWSDGVSPLNIDDLKIYSVN